MLPPLRSCLRGAVRPSLPSQRALTLHRTTTTTKWPSKLRPTFTVPPTGQGFASAKKNDKTYTKTLQLPETHFPMRAEADRRHTRFRKRTTSDLYRWQKEHNTGDLFVLHDGPPYANGSLHLGHALNKMLKDIINRYQVLQGRRVHYHPGWDCHGLPIENKAVGHFQDTPLAEIPLLQLRAKAREEAQKGIDLQRSEFEQFGIMADFSDSEATYRTFDLKYELRQLKIFGEMVRRGLIFRAHRPVWWAPATRTALAEAELEYTDKYVSRSVFTRFDLEPGPTLRAKLEADPKLRPILSQKDPISMVIWTTTPWTLPSNMAAAVNAEFEYSLVRALEGPTRGEVFLVATERVRAFMQLKLGLSTSGGSDRTKLGLIEELVKFEGSELLDSKYRHLFLPPHADSRPILAAPFVTAESGTGIVHIAPGHGADDYALYRSTPSLAHEPVLSPLDERGCYTDDVAERGPRGPELVGLSALGSGGKALNFMLAAEGMLVSEYPINHRYPLDWRGKLPVIMRATSQWFANLDAIKDDAVAALQHVKFTPESGRAKLEQFVRNRSEWCISRQRAWGVPIPVVYDVGTQEPLLTPANVEHIIEVLAEKGMDHWWVGEAEEFVAPQYRDARAWRKGMDTIDVWFDSGSSWSHVRDEVGAEREAAGKPLTDVYLEGVDQHRGWFQSSLLTAIATAPEGSPPRAPYAEVITHDFVVDKRSNKMSKSLGNVIHPLFLINGGVKKNDVAFGTDPLRFWAAQADYSSIVRISPLIVKHASQALSKLRNSARFMLANLPPPEEVPPLKEQELSLLDRHVLHELFLLDKGCREAYEAYDFAFVISQLNYFVTSTLSAMYFDMAKDILYADAPSAPRRKATVATLDQILRTVTSILAPITPHLAEEIYYFRNGAVRDPKLGEDGPSVFQELWQGVDPMWHDKEVEDAMRALLQLRITVLGVIEQARAAGNLKGAIEADVVLYVNAVEDQHIELAALITQHLDQLPTLFMVSHVHLSKEPPPVEALEESQFWKYRTEHHGVVVTVRPSYRLKCPRCWVHRREKEETVCGRCKTSLGEMGLEDMLVKKPRGSEEQAALEGEETGQEQESESERIEEEAEGPAAKEKET